MAAILKRNPDPVIDLDDAWADDPFDRKPEGELLCRLIESGAEEPLVISLQSPWGSGKTVFLRRVAAHIQKTRGIPAVVIDAWKSDDCDDALATIVAELTILLSTAGAGKGWKERADKAISQLALHGSKVLLPGLSLVADMTAPGSGQVLRVAGKYGAQLLDAQLMKKEASRDFRSSLIEARDIITKRRAGRPARPMLLIIDELDRCRPDHAIRMLERVKHYFDVEGITFLIATDHGNLPSAVKTVYGDHVDGELYLRKFFDYEFHLRAPSPAAFARLLVGKNIYPGTDLLDFKAVLKGARYQHEVVSNGQVTLSDEVAKFEYATCFAEFSSQMSLSLRDQAQAITVLTAFISTYNQNRFTIPVIDCFVACFRFGFPSRFRMFLDTGVVDLSYDAKSADSTSVAKVGSSPLALLVTAFFKLKFDGGEGDAATLDSIKRRHQGQEIYDPITTVANLTILRLRTPLTGGIGYGMSVARLADAFSSDMDS